MNKINDKNYKVLTPFKGWVLENFPFIEADFDAITNYELYCKIVEYLNNVIYNQNQVQELGSELVDGYNDVVDYVNNYFNNLDVTEEINSKLDKMAQDGSFEPLLNTLFQEYYNVLEHYVNNQVENKVDKNGVGQITYNNLSQSVKEMFTGGSVAVVGTNSVSDTNIIDSSISYQKLSLNGKKGCVGINQPMEIDFEWENGTRHTGGVLNPSTNTIVITNPILLQYGDIIKVNNGYKMYCFYIDDNNVPHQLYSGWQSNIMQLIGGTINIEYPYYIEIRKNDETDIEPSEGIDAVTFIRKQLSEKNSYSSFSNDIQQLLNNKATSIKIDDTISYGSAIDQTKTGFQYYQTSHLDTDERVSRAWLDDPIYLPAGTRLQSGEDYSFLLIRASTRNILPKVYFPSSYVNDYTLQNDEIVYIYFKKTDNSILYENDFLNNLTITLPISDVNDSICYVSGQGSDITGDGTSLHPYREISHAIELGLKTIIVDGNYKYNNITLNNLHDIKIMGKYNDYNISNNPNYKKPYFDNSIVLQNGVLDNGKIKITYNASETSSLYNGTITKTEPLEDNVSARSHGYYTTIYSNKGKENSHRYIPVLEQDDIAGHYYDGTYIYINPYNNDTISDTYYLIDYNEEQNHRLVSISNCSNIIIENFDFNHASGDLLYIDKSNDIKITNCEFKGSSLNNNLASNNTNIIINDCVSYLSRNDGFNFHGFGKSILNNCQAWNCFDDGISHHDQSDTLIVGGEFAYNNKGGISSPINGSQATIMGTKCHHNITYGIYGASESIYPNSYINCNNNIIYNNPIGIRIVKTDGCIYNNKYLNNTTNKTIHSTSNIIDLD